MAATGRYARTILGIDPAVMGLVSSGNASTTAMSALNTGVAMRFTAMDTRDIYSLWINWSTVSAPGAVQVRLETIDTTTGKPTGTLYDINASVTITPAAGWQQATFASNPTTNLVAGNEYAIVILTTTGGTTQTLRSNVNFAQGMSIPAVLLTAADGTTRTNFAEVGNAAPIATLVFSDGSEEAYDLVGTATTVSFNVYSTRAVACKFVTSVPIKIMGVVGYTLSKNGAPANLRAQIFDSSNNLVTGMSLIVQKTSLTNTGVRRWLFPGYPYTLAAGTYRIVFDQTDHTTTSSNDWVFVSAQGRSASVIASGWILSTTPDITATPIVWTDDATQCVAIGLLAYDIPAVSGGGGTRRRAF